jgi:glycosyltransferase involved in cell wall biosynthesis
MKLSVLVITYNHAQFIAQALTSALEQRVNFEYEIVVGEDCSTDTTREILADFCYRYPGRIVPLFRDQNIGALPNLAATLAACRGQYIAFLEGDDYWTRDDKLQRQVDILDEHSGTAICCHRVELLDEKGIAELGSSVYPTMDCGAYSIRDLLKSNFVMTCSAVLRKDFIGTLPAWFAQMALGDWPLFALAATHGNIVLLDDVMAAYRAHPDGIWSSRPKQYRLLETSRMLKTLDRHLQYRYTGAIRPTLASLYLKLALIERENGNRLATGRHLLASLWNGGNRFSLRLIGSIATYVILGSRYQVFL